MTKKTETNPFTAMFADMPVDMSAFSDAFKSSAALSEKLSGIALSAAEKNAEISAKWTRDALARMTSASKAQAGPEDYSNAMKDLSSAMVEAASENVAAYAEVAKKVQMDTVELLMAAGKDAQAEAAATVRKTTDDAVGAVKKAASKAV